MSEEKLKSRVRLASCAGSGGPREEGIWLRQDKKERPLHPELLAETPPAHPSTLPFLQPCPSATGLASCPSCAGWGLNSRACHSSSHPVFHLHPVPLSLPSSQVIENARRQSVEGLALPFLSNWLLGMTDTPMYR
jgi:PQ loop repeat protein